MFSFSLGDSKERLEKIAEDLQVNSEVLNNEFIQIEQKLANMNLGVTAWANDTIGSPDKKQYKFGFCKLKNDWKLVCREVSSDNGKDSDKGKYGLLSPITFMPRHVRVQAGAIIGQVIENINKKAEVYSKEMKASSKNIAVEVGKI